MKSLPCLVLGAILAHARVAAADPAVSSRAVILERSTCEATPMVEVTSILRVELHDRLLLLPPDASPPIDAYRAAIDCSGDVVQVSVSMPGGARMSLETNLSGTPANVRARIVALTVAELVRDSDREADEPVPPVPAAAAPLPPLHAPPGKIDETSASAVSDRAIELGAFVQTSSFHLSGAWLVGGGLRADYSYRWLRVGLDAALLGATEHFDLGTAQVLAGYGSPFAGWTARWARARTLLGAGYAFGVASARGHATQPNAFAGTTTGAWSAPYGFAALEVTVTNSVSVGARGQLGWVTLPVVGDVAGGSAIAVEGAWASFQVGVAIGL